MSRAIPDLKQQLKQKLEQKQKARTLLINFAKKIFTSSLGKSEKAQLLKEILDNANLSMNIEGHQDSNEFLTFCLDQLLPVKDYIVDMNTTSYSTASPSKKTEVNSKHEFQVTDQKQQFSTLLTNYQKQEELTAESIVNDGATAVKKSLRTQNTNCDIVFSLKKFKGKGHEENFRSTKISSVVEFDQINLTSCGGETTKYEPTAFIVHRGGINGGHYVAYVKEETKSNNGQWFRYDDGTKTPLTESLPEETKEAYTVKYSPIANETATGADRYKNGLPASQGNCGIRNLGSKCWAIAGLTFALSMSSLSQKNLETPEVPELNFSNDDVGQTFHNPDMKTELSEEITQITTITPKNYEIKNPQFRATTSRNFLEISDNPSKDFRLEILICIRHNQDTLTDQEIGAIILIAIKNRGIGNDPVNLRKDLEALQNEGLINTDKSIEDLAKAAIKFSGLFQKSTKQNKIYTGNENATSLEGMRLKRLDPSFAEQFLGEEKYQEIYNKFKISEIEKKEQETASPHPKKPTGKPLGQDQEQEQQQ